MKKMLFVAALGSILLACTKDNEPTQPQQVTFNVSGWQSTTESLSPVKRAALDLIDDTDVLTDLYLFDGDTQLVHQVSTDADFGTITVLLTVGDHALHFVATRSSGLSYENGILACTSLRNTFGKTINLSVNGSSEEAVVLERLTGKLVITINDAIPSGAANLNIQLGNRYTSLNVATLYGVSPAPAEFNQNLTGKIGNTGYQITLHMLAPDDDGYETTFTLTATNGSGATIGQASGTITIAQKTKTMLSGNLFAGTSSIVSLNTAWSADINESF